MAQDPMEQVQLVEVWDLAVQDRLVALQEEAFEEVDGVPVGYHQQECQVRMKKARWNSIRVGWIHAWRRSRNVLMTWEHLKSKDL